MEKNKLRDFLKKVQALSMELDEEERNEGATAALSAQTTEGSVGGTAVNENDGEYIERFADSNDCENAHTPSEGVEFFRKETYSNWSEVENDMALYFNGAYSEMCLCSLFILKDSITPYLIKGNDMSAIKSAHLKFKVAPESYFASFSVNEENINFCGFDYDVDVTYTFKKASREAQIEFLPGYFAEGKEDLYILFTDFVLEIEYYSHVFIEKDEFIDDDSYYRGSSISMDINTDLNYAEKTFTAAGGAQVSVNLVTGKTTVSVDGLATVDSLIPVRLSHVYTGESDNKYGCGYGWQLNLYETLTRGAVENFVYTDGFGRRHICEDAYYYLDGANKVIVDKSKVTVESDGTLTYSGREVFKEECTDTGLIFSGKYSRKFKNIKYFEQRTDEQKQLEEQIKSYENFFDSYLTVNENLTASIWLKNKNYEYSSDFEEFITSAKSSEYCVTESEWFNLKSLSQQKKDYESEGKVEGKEDYKRQDNINLCVEQMQQYAKKKDETVEQLEKYYKEYVNAKFKLAELERQLPENYASDGKIVKAFNKAGQLVAICDAYENAVVLDYDNKGKITGLYHNNSIEIKLNYDSNGYLVDMIDGYGKKIAYDYLNGRLKKITNYCGRSVAFEYDSYISKIASDENEITELKYSDVKLKDVNNLAEETGNKKIINRYGISYGTNQATINASDYYEEYEYSRNYLTGYTLVENGLVVQAEKYEYTKNKNKIIQRADPKSLNRHSQADFEFVAKERAEITLNSFDLPVTRTETGLDNGDGITKKVTHYYYDNDGRLVKAEVACYGSSGTALYTAVSESVYDVYGNVAREESYVSGEEETKGKQITEHFYDDKGREVKSCSYNSLDTGSKFYTRSDYDEQGKQVASYDETGENPVKYEYKNGTQTVQTEIYPNGGKLSYGYDVDGTVTGITQSTADGEENSTRKVYKNGKPVKLESGNTTVEYAYDYKGRTTEIKLNGKVYQTFEYRDKVTQGDKIVDVVTMTNANGETFESTVDSYGNVISVKQGSQIVTTAKYNKNGDALEVYDGITGIRESNLYDGYGRLNNHTSGGITDSLIYDGNGKVSRAILGGREYRYEYETDAAKTLKSVKTDGFAFAPQTDKLGRNTGREISGSSGKIASEHISYRKVGDHATNMPGTVWYGGRKNGAYAITENIRYKYDSCGNISEILENGVTVTRYEYDTIGRIIREDNKPLGKTVTYNYDGNGNITDKRVYEYTLRKELGEPKDEKIYSYNGDQLISYGEETFVYDKIGNPTIYRDRDLEWSNGRQLKSFSAMPFNYDGKGRRISKGEISFTYDVNGRLVSQSNGLEFIYDNSGIAALKYGNSYYFYRKDAQGNIIALIDSNGNKVVQYIYDAWGNHSISGDEVLGNLNPFRYRSYYYDTETGLYYLQTRYYDPETGRFISQDSIEYADPETINGLNLYAYCGNNPVMRIDPTGTFLFSFLIAVLAGALIGGLVGGVSAVANGDNFWGGFLSGALVGGVLGGAMILGGATMLAVAGKAVSGFVVASTFAAKATLLATTVIGTATVSFVAGMGAYAIEESINGREVNTSEMIRQGINTGIKGLISFGTGMILATTGVYNYLLENIKWSFAEKIKMMVVRSTASFFLQFPWKLGLK